MTTRTRARLGASQLSEYVINEAVGGFFSPANARVRKWNKVPVKFGQIKLNSWQPEHDQLNPELQDLRQGLDRKVVKSKKRLSLSNEKNAMRENSSGRPRKRGRPSINSS